MNSNAVNKFFRQALALSFLSLSCAVLAQQGELVPVPTPLGESQRYAFAGDQQSPGIRAVYNLEPLPSRPGEAQRYNLIKISGGFSGVNSPLTSHPVYVQSPASSRGLGGSGNRSTPLSIFVQNPTSSSTSSSFGRPPVSSVSATPPLTLSNIRGSSGRRSASLYPKDDSSFLLGLSRAGITEEYTTLAVPGVAGVPAAGIQAIPAIPAMDVEEGFYINTLWLGYGLHGSAIGVDLLFGIGSTEFVRTVDGVERSLSGFEAEVLSSRLDFRLFPRSFVQPFLTFERQVAGADLSDDEAPRGYVSYAGFGLRFKLSSGIALSLGRYEDPDDESADPDVYDRAQLTFSF